MTILAKDIMTSPVVTVTPDTPLKEVAAILEENHFSGVPVVDENEALIGIVSEADILHYTQQIIGQPIRKPYKLLTEDMEVLHVNALNRGVEMLELVAAATVEKLMSRNVVSVKETAPVNKVIQIMNEENINRVPVVDEQGKIIGLISRGDIIRVLSEKWDALSE